MKTITVGKAQVKLRQLIQEAHDGDVVLLADGDRLVRLKPYDPSDPSVDLDLEEDSPELEAELLKAVRGPHAPYSHAEMKAALGRVCDEEHQQRKKRRE